MKEDKERVWGGTLQGWGRPKGAENGVELRRVWYGWVCGGCSAWCVDGGLGQGWREVR